MKINITNRAKGLFWLMLSLATLRLAMHTTDSFMEKMLIVYSVCFAVMAVVSNWKAVKEWLKPSNYLNR